MGVERKFTSKVKETLLNNITKEEKRNTPDDWYVFDFISDQLDLHSVKYSSDKAEQYYDYIVDKKNASAKEINQIWTDVGRVDYDYSIQYQKTKELVDKLKEKVDLITETIQDGKKINGNPDEFGKLFNKIDSEIETATANNEKEKLVIHKPDGTTEYNWELYKEYMGKSSSDITQAQYEALIDIYRDMMNGKDYKNVQTMFENSYIMEDGLWYMPNGTYHKQHISEVFESMEQLYGKSVILSMNEQIEGLGVTPSQLINISDADLKANGLDNLIELKQYYKNELLNQTVIHSVATQAEALFTGDHVDPFTITEEVSDLGEGYRKIIVKNQSFLTTKAGNEPYDPKFLNMDVYDYRDASRIDKIADMENMKNLESMRQDSLATDRSDATSAAVSFIKCEIVTNAGQKIGESLVKEEAVKIAGLVGSKFAGVANAAIDCGVTIIQDEEAAQFINGTIDKCEDNTLNANLLDICCASANVTCNNGRMTVTNMSIDKAELNDRLANSYSNLGINADDVVDYINKDYDKLGAKKKVLVQQYINARMIGN